MTDYKQLAERLRKVSAEFGESDSVCDLLMEAANAVDELFNAGTSMHLWIYFHVADEQEVYKTCHLSDELNRAFGSVETDEVHYGTDP